MLDGTKQEDTLDVIFMYIVVQLRKKVDAVVCEQVLVGTDRMQSLTSQFQIMNRFPVREDVFT
jgi:hypothetical protein